MKLIRSAMLSLCRSNAYRSLGLVWIGSLLIVAMTDVHSLLIGLGAATFAALLIMFTAMLLDAPPTVPPETLRATGTCLQRLIQSFIIGFVCVWAVVYGCAYGSLLSGGQSMWLPHLSPLMSTLFGHLVEPLHDTWGTYFGFGSLVLVPGCLMLLCGRTPRSMGLAEPANNVTRATLACITLALVLAAIGLATRKITFAGLCILLLHNFFSNGFAEEFVSRGMLLSQLRSQVPEDWAMVLQAGFFSVYHFGSTMPEPHVHLNVLYALANNLALNAPLGIALGFMAVRGRSLLQGTIVHMFLDTLTKTL